MTPTFSTALLDAMRALAEEHNCERVEIQTYAEEFAPDGKTKMSSPHSVLYLPGLGWTTKDDVKTPSWGDATILVTVEAQR